MIVRLRFATRAGKKRNGTVKVLIEKVRTMRPGWF